MKVLVLSGRFGMGHEMAANAICEQFRKLDKDTEIVKKDLLEELYPHISKLIFGGFRLMVEHCHGWRTTRCDRLYTSDVCKGNCII